MRIATRIGTLAIVPAVIGLLFPAPVRAEAESPFDRVVGSIIEREAETVRSLSKYHPLVETYVQTLEPDGDLGAVPRHDEYFLGKLDLGDEVASVPLTPKPGLGARMAEFFKELYSYRFVPRAFARMVLPDADSFDREHYDFEFVRREFLGEIRTLVIDVTPREGAASDRFIGRIWVEDQDYNIVRFNGTHTSYRTQNASFHFDSWRMNMEPGLWLPAMVYTEESEYKPMGQRGLMFKAQTRLWGYEPQHTAGEDEFTKVVVDTPLAEDRTESDGDISPVGSLRAWEREAEDNVLRRLEKAALLAPESEVDAVLRTVVTNLEITNGLEIEPPVRCRVLLTTPLESFTVGHTIVLSRGLIDVLPDEASLAMVLAHELSHITLGHRLDTMYAFSDRMLVGDAETIARFDFRRDPGEEYAADRKALTLLEHSPYKEELGNAGLFLKALNERVRALPALIQPHFGNRLGKKKDLVRMAGMMKTAPELDPRSKEQIAALPLGGRVKVDPWTATIELMKNSQVPLLSAREKMPFEVTPMMPWLVRRQPPETIAARTAQTPAPESGTPGDPDEASAAEPPTAVAEGARP